MATISKLIIELGLDDHGLSDGLGRAANKLGGFKGSIMSAGQSMTKAFTLPVAGGLTTSLLLAANFEKQMSAVQAVIGDEGTPRTMERLQKLALETSTNSIFSATEIALAYTELAKAGLSAQNIMDGAGEAATFLAHATGGDLAKSAEIVAIAMTQFGLEGTDATRVADVLTMGANASVATVESLGQSLSYTGGAARNMSLSLEDTVAMLMMMADAGLKGSRTGTNLQQALVAIAKPPPQARGEWERLGIEIEDVNGNFVGMEKLLPQLYDAIKDMGNLERTSTLDKLFGKLGGRAMNALLLTQTEEAIAAGKGWDYYMNAVYNAGGAAAKQSSILLDNLTGSFKKFRNTLHVAAIEIGLLFTPVARKLLDALSRMIKVFIKLPAPIKMVIVVFASLLALIGPALIAFALLAAAISSVLGMAVYLSAALTVLSIGFIIALTKLDSFWKSFVKVSEAMADAFVEGKRIDDILSRFPTSVQGAVRPLLNLSDAIGDIYFAFSEDGFQAGLDAIREGASRLLEAGLDVGLLVLRAVASFMLLGGNAVLDTAGKIWEWIKTQAGFGNEANMGDGTGGPSPFGSEGIPIGEILFTALANIKMKLENGLEATWSNIVDWAEKKLFEGYRGKESITIPKFPELQFGDLSNIEFANETDFMIVRNRVEGIFQDWARANGFVFKITNDAGRVEWVTDWAGIRNKLIDDIRGKIEDITVRGIAWTLLVGYPKAVEIGGRLLSGASSAVTGGMSWIEQKIVSALWPEGDARAVTIKDIVIKLVDVSVDIAPEWANNIRNNIFDAISSKTGKGMLSGAQSMASGAGSAASSIAKDIMYGIGYQFGALTSIALQTSLALLAAISTAINSAIEDPRSILELGDNIYKWVLNALDAIGEKGASALKIAAREMAQGFLDGFSDTFVLDDIFSDTETLIGGASGQIVTKKGLYNSIIDSITGLLNNIKDYDYAGAAGDIWDGLLDAVTGAWDRFKANMEEYLRQHVPDFLLKMAQGDYFGALKSLVGSGSSGPSGMQGKSVANGGYLPIAGLASPSYTNAFGETTQDNSLIPKPYTPEPVVVRPGPAPGNPFGAAPVPYTRHGDTGTSMIPKIDTSPVVTATAEMQKFMNITNTQMPSAIGKVTGAGASLTTFTNKVKTDFTGLNTQAGAAIQSFTQKGQENFRRLATTGSTEMQRMVSLVTGKFVLMSAQAIGIANQTRYSVANTFVGLRGDIYSIVGSIDLFGPGNYIGSSLGYGIWAGFSAWTGVLTALVASTVDAMILTAQNRAGISSPSKAMMEIADYMVDGLILPFETREREITSAVTGAIDIPAAYGFDESIGFNSYNVSINVDAANSGDPESVAQAIFDAFAREIKLKTGV